MMHPNLYQLSHGWANKYYWFSLVQDVYVGMDFIDGIRKGELTLDIDKGTTEADLSWLYYGTDLFLRKNRFCF